MLDGAAANEHDRETEEGELVVVVPTVPVGASGLARCRAVGARASFWGGRVAARAASQGTLNMRPGALARAAEAVAGAQWAGLFPGVPNQSELSGAP